MKGIVLAGGTGSRLWPMTLTISKQLLPIYNKPLIYYPIAVLMQAEIREMLIITTADDQTAYKSLLGDGSAFGVSFSYAIQERPKGIAQAFIIGKKFIGGSDVALILGDNLFYGDALASELHFKLGSKGAKIFTYAVTNASEFGVLNTDDENKPLSVIEKPRKSKSNLAITGLYFFDSKVTDYATQILPSERGELEITSIIQKYIDNKDLEFMTLSNGIAWLDTGNPNSLNDAASFVRILEERTGKKIACLEEIAYKKDWITHSELTDRIKLYENNSYALYLKVISQKTNLKNR